MRHILSGMTGFSRVSGDAPWGRWAWEAKSVNGRSLDIRVNLPPGAEGLEKEVKAGAAARFTRGSLQIGLRLDLSGAAAASVHVDEALLVSLAGTVGRLSGQSPGPEVLASLMMVRGVVETGSPSTRDLLEGDGGAVLLSEGADRVLDELLQARRAEGHDLQRVLGDLIDQAASLTEAAATQAASQPGLVRARLLRQLEELGAEARVDGDRLAVEAALAAARADVREEIDRLQAHIASARQLLSAGSPAGRQLDFLAQEMNREANTLCSKSASLDLTNAGLGLKGVIDQIREQAANVE